MNISIIQRVRAASPEQRFTALADAICNDDVDDDSVHIIAVQKALHQLEKVVFEISSGPYLRFAQLGHPSREQDVVVIAKTEDGRIIKKSNSTKQGTDHYVVYDFLKDYLGLACKSPLSPIAMLEKYPKLNRNKEILSELVAQSCCDSIALALLKRVKFQVYMRCYDVE